MDIQRALGWIPDIPDIRDHSPDDTKGHRTRNETRSKSSSAVTKWFKQSAALKAGGLENRVDLSPYCSEIEDQGNLGSCTANAGIGLIEYYERRAFGRHLDASRLFLYKVTRKLMNVSGDTGAYLRTTMQAMTLFGAPPEQQYPYQIPHFDDEPTAFDYAWAQNYQTLSYFRLDQPEVSGKELLSRIKHFLQAGYPSMFGFPVYSDGNAAGEFPFPDANSQLLGGHAVVAIGYDEQKRIGNSTGALKIRNSWGKNWGERGYGWLPFDYVSEGLAVDFWSVFRQEYIDTGKFG